MWKIIIDNREKELNPEYEHEKKSLEVGDIIIERDNKPIVAIERKSESDFYQSMRDGRFREQRARLVASNIRWIFYLIEETPNLNTGKFSPDFLKQMMIHLQVKYNIKVIWAKTLEETARLIMLIQKKAKLVFENDTTGIEGEALPAPGYLANISVKKKDNLTPEICFLLQLEQIPGVSKQIAAKIAENFPTWKVLMNAFVDKSAEESKNILSKLQVTEKRKIGPKTAEKLITYLGI